MNAKIIILAGSVAPFTVGLGIGQVLHGHSWGYQLLVTGLAGSVALYVRMARDWPFGRRCTQSAEEEAARDRQH